MNTNSRIWPARRKLLKRAGLSALVLTGMMSRNARAAIAKPRGIDQPARGTPQAFTDRAFAMMQQAVDSGDQPYGAVVVKGGRIVGQSQSRVILDRDPTGHAEMAAIRDAARRLANRDLIPTGIN